MKPVKTIMAKMLLTAPTAWALFSVDQALAQSGRYGNWPMGRGMMGGWGMGWFGGIFMIIFWVLILVALVYFIKWLIQSTGRGPTDRAGGNRALDILQERYARGEIDKAEFETMKRDLSN